MYTPEEHFVMNLADIYSLLFGYIGDGLIRAFSMQGEASVREAARRFGKDRGRTLREKHLSIGAKINMKNLFSLYPDLPSDPRFKRELQTLSPQERISHTLFCPMAAIWESHGQKEIGRIYCEEFHPACYGEYGYGYTSVNLARTQTQENDEYCSFRVILRPADLPAKLQRASRILIRIIMSRPTIRSSACPARTDLKCSPLSSIIICLQPPWSRSARNAFLSSNPR